MERVGDLLHGDHRDVFAVLIAGKGGQGDAGSFGQIFQCQACPRPFCPNLVEFLFVSHFSVPFPANFSRFPMIEHGFLIFLMLDFMHRDAPTSLYGRNPAALPAGGGADLRVAVLARDIAHTDNAVTRAVIIPLVFLGHLPDALAPAVMELAGVGIDYIVAVRRRRCGAGGLI